ncbi:hypothetical protein [Aeoliella sp. SH292]|uniref:hypothetical protein n=1 Tax=Aeoliella sp. SH292 TaxID=3454464 RepID=UPI003F9CA391
MSAKPIRPPIETSTKFIVGSLIFIAIVLLWLFFGVLLHAFFPTYTAAGTYGDSFGMVNSLFSGLALFAVIMTLWIQSDELRHAIKEFSAVVDAQEQTAQQQYVAALVSAVQGVHQLEESRNNKNLGRYRKDPRQLYALINEFKCRRTLMMVVDGMLLRPESRNTQELFGEKWLETTRTKMDIAARMAEIAILTEKAAIALRSIASKDTGEILVSKFTTEAYPHLDKLFDYTDAFVEDFRDVDHLFVLNCEQLRCRVPQATELFERGRTEASWNRYAPFTELIATLDGFREELLQVLLQDLGFTRPSEE